MAPVTLSTVDSECYSLIVGYEANKTDDLKDIIQQLFEIQSAVHGYLGHETQQELVRKMYAYPTNLPTHTHTHTHTNINRKTLTLALSTLSSHTQDNPPQPSDPQQQSQQGNPDPPLSSIQLPPEIIDYVDSARNPDIYTREFVELVQRGNQDLKGKREAFASFRDVLAREMRSAMPECRGEVERVMREA